MGNLSARLVIGFFETPEALRFWYGDWQGQIIFADVTCDMGRERLAENSAGSNSAPIIATEADDVFCEFVEARHGIVGHANLAVPFTFEITISQLRKQSCKRPLGPGAVNGGAGVAKGSDAAEDKASSLIHAEG